MNAQNIKSKGNLAFVCQEPHQAKQYRRYPDTDRVTYQNLVCMGVETNNGEIIKRVLLETQPNLRMIPSPYLNLLGSCI